MKAGAAATKWGRRAADLYRSDYARTYREHDDELDRGDVYALFTTWLGDACRAAGGPIDVLDLGCGTGRYFSALPHVKSIVGIDASAEMLAEARRPLHADRVATRDIELVEGDFLTHDFGAARFDLVYSIGVLAEHTPLDETVVDLVGRWLRRGGRFAFSTVHPESPSIPRTLGRSLGRTLEPWTRGMLQSRLRERLLSGGMYADERRVRALLEPLFVVESLTRMHSEAHLHVLCVARKTL